jgi:cupin superfamily acireductone dioxygenase involved in methionine salvage
VGENSYGQCDVGNWTDIIEVTAGVAHTVGLKSDGTVVAVGENAYGQCDVGNWTDIIEVTGGSYHTVGLKSDRTVVAVGLETELAKWNLGITEGKPLINWPLVGGSIAAAVIVGLVLFFVLRRKSKTAK